MLKLAFWYEAFLYFSDRVVQASIDEERQHLLDCIDEFVKERITVADDQIVIQGVTKIGCTESGQKRALKRAGVDRVEEGDVIMTHASSHVVKRILLEAHKQKKMFRVIVVDSRPLCEGVELARTLSDAGIHSTYVLPSALSYVMQDVTKVFVGAYALLSNGSVISRVGTALVASMAQAYRVPFIVCCETCKFSDRVLLDSICFNQLGDPYKLIVSPALREYKASPDPTKPAPAPAGP